jgi:hypothetical protein
MKFLGSNRSRVFVGIIIACVSTIAVTITIMHWRETHAITQRVTTARDDLRREIDVLEDIVDDSSVRSQEIRRFHIGSINDVIQRLDAGPIPLPHPIPVFAYARETAEGDPRVELCLQWIENDFEVCGFYVSDHAGSVTDFPAALIMSESERRPYSRTAMRYGSIGIISDDSDAEWWRGMGRSGVNTPGLARLPPGYLNMGGVRLGLLTKEGRAPITTIVQYLTREDLLASRSSGDPDNQ